MSWNLSFTRFNNLFWKSTNSLSEILRKQRSLNFWWSKLIMKIVLLSFFMLFHAKLSRKIASKQQLLLSNKLFNWNTLHELDAWKIRRKHISKQIDRYECARSKVDAVNGVLWMMDDDDGAFCGCVIKMTGIYGYGKNVFISKVRKISRTYLIWNCYFELGK